MKKTLISFIMIGLFALGGKAQNIRSGGWAEQWSVGAAFQVNSTWLLNSAISNLSDGKSDPEFSLGYNLGLSGGFRFNPNMAVGVDVQYFKHNQKYSGKENGTFWESTIGLSGVQIPVYGKFMTNSGAFIEVGWQFGFVTAAKYNRTSISTSESGASSDVKESYTKVIHSPHVGLGVDWFLNDSWAITTGVRFNYGINDMKGVDGYERDLNDDPMYPDPQKTNALSGGIFVGVRYLMDAGGRY